VNSEIGEFEHNGREGAFRNWLRQITANRMRRLWQKKSSKAIDESGTNIGVLGEQLADSKSRLTLVWETQHNQFVVNQLMTRLTKRFTDTHLSAFRRIVLQEEPAQKVADDYDMTLGAVRVVQHRVLRALRELGQGLID
jgi:DNA-directed RNA polymerase specialized sigma24 family protein